jgi:phage FluMu protein Com
MEETIFVAGCPICGRTLFKGKPNSYIEGGCPKCRSYLQIYYTDNGIKIIIHEVKQEK